MFFTVSPLGDILIIIIAVTAIWVLIDAVYNRRVLLLSPLGAFIAGFSLEYVIYAALYGEVFISWHEDGVFEKTLLLALVSLIAVVVGHNLNAGERLGKRLFRMPKRLSAGKMLVASIVLIVLGIIGYAYQIASAGSLDEWLSVGKGGTDWLHISHWIAGLSKCLLVGIVLLLFRAEIHRLPLGSKVVAWGAISLLAFWYFYLGSRGMVITSIVTMFAAYYLPRRRNPNFVLAAVTFCLLLAAVHFIARNRSNFTNLSLNLDTIDWEEEKSLSLPPWLGGKLEAQRESVSRGQELNCAMTAVELVPKHVDYNYGYCLLGFFTRPVPRRFWPGKRYPHFEAFTPIYALGELSFSWTPPCIKRPTLAGPAFTFVGHWYAVGGIIALLLAGILTGILYRAFWTIYSRNWPSQGDIVLYSSLIIIGFRDAVATPLFWIFSIPFIQLPLILLLKFCSVDEKGKTDAT